MTVGTDLGNESGVAEPVPSCPGVAVSPALDVTADAVPVGSGEDVVGPGVGVV